MKEGWGEAQGRVRVQSKGITTSGVDKIIIKMSLSNIFPSVKSEETRNHLCDLTIRIPISIYSSCKCRWTMDETTPKSWSWYSHNQPITQQIDKTQAAPTTMKRNQKGLLECIHFLLFHFLVPNWYLNPCIFSRNFIYVLHSIRSKKETESKGLL